MSICVGQYVSLSCLRILSAIRLVWKSRLFVVIFWWGKHQCSLAVTSLCMYGCVCVCLCVLIACLVGCWCVRQKLRLWLGFHGPVCVSFSLKGRGQIQEDFCQQQLSGTTPPVEVLYVCAWPFYSSQDTVVTDMARIGHTCLIGGSWNGFSWSSCVLPWENRQRSLA